MELKDNIEKLVNDKGMQMRDFRLTNVETRKTEDDKEVLVLEGVACSFDTETVLCKYSSYEYREKIASGAFDGCDMTDVIFNYNHCGRVYARTRNNTLRVEVKSDGLYMRAELMAEDNGHQELYRDIKSGLIDKMSFAFTIRQASYEYIENTDGPDVYIRTVTEIEKLYDVSAVDIPAYDTTSISARGAFDAEREKREAESRKLEEERAAELNLALARYNYLKMEV